MTHEIRNTHEAKDDEPSHFLPPRAVAEYIDHALPDLRRARDRTQYVPHHNSLAHIVGQLEDLAMLLRTERHR